METIFMNTVNGKLIDYINLLVKKNKTICYSSKLIYLLHVKKFQTAVQEQWTEKNRISMEWWALIARWFLFSVKQSRLYQICHKKVPNSNWQSSNLYLHQQDW